MNIPDRERLQLKVVDDSIPIEIRFARERFVDKVKEDAVLEVSVLKGELRGAATEHCDGSTVEHGGATILDVFDYDSSGGFANVRQRIIPTCVHQ